MRCNVGLRDFGAVLRHKQVRAHSRDAVYRENNCIHKHPKDPLTPSRIPWCVNMEVSAPQKMNYKYRRRTETRRVGIPHEHPTRARQFRFIPHFSSCFRQIARLPSFQIP